MRSPLVARINSLTSILVVLLFFGIAVTLIAIDRSIVLDNDNYIEYFRGTRFDDMVNLLRDSFTIEKIAIVFFSEEFIWLLFTKIFQKYFHRTYQYIFSHCW